MIQLKNIFKTFRNQEVLKGVNLEIPKGKITVILGTSGQGKTVLLKHLIGFYRPDKGQVIVEGTDISSLSETELNKFRRRFGMLFQEGALFDSLTVSQNVAFPLREHTSLSEGEIKKRVRELLGHVGLEGAGDKMPSELSGGMRKRVGLARAIALQPEIILYDEPTTGLDPLMTRAINQLILDMEKKFGVTSVIISHDIESAFSIANKISMLHEGKIIEEGSPEAFRASRHPFVKEFLTGLL